MKKNILLITLLVIISAIAISGCTSNDNTDVNSTDTKVKPVDNTYPANVGKVTPKSSTLTLKYNDAKSTKFYFKYDDGDSDTVYYDKKIIEGSVKINLTRVKWKKNDDNVDLSGKPYDKNEKSDPQYAKEHFLKDIQKDFKNLNKECEIYFYTQNDNSVNLKDNSKVPKPIKSKIKLNGTILTVKLFKDYQVNATEKIGKSYTYHGALSIGEQPDTHKITHAKLAIDLYNSKYSYRIYVKLNKPLFKMIMIY